MSFLQLDIQAATDVLLLDPAAVAMSQKVYQASKSALDKSWVALRVNHVNFEEAKKAFDSQMMSSNIDLDSRVLAAVKLIEDIKVASDQLSRYI